MSQNTLKVHDLNEDAEFDENGVEVFDEKALVERNPVIAIWLRKSFFRREQPNGCLMRRSFISERLVIPHC